MDIYPSKTGNSGFSSQRLIKLAGACLIAFTLLLAVTVIFPNKTSDLHLSKPEFFKEKAGNETSSSSFGANSSASEKRLRNKQLLDGLLAPGFDKESCLSRYQSSFYHRNAPHKPSAYLLSKLREYERRHKRCGPYSENYSKSVIGFASSDQVNNNATSDCNYIVWVGVNGLGNRILSMASAFLYALLTNRVLLTHQARDLVDLFCEPFPNSSWLLPQDFPLQNQFYDREMVDFHSYGKLLYENNNNTSRVSPPPFLYLYLVYDYGEYDKLFYLDQHQGFLRNVPWLISVSDQYNVPSLFTISTFQEELDKLFPIKDSVFHHLGRYLFHPSNQAWGLITRFYQAYLANADERIGLQIRVFDPHRSPSNIVMDQLLACSGKEQFFPEVGEQTNNVASPSNNRTLKAILITSLRSEYYANISNMYWTKPTAKGEIVSVYQPSHEAYQHFGDNTHNVKAWAEMYLISLSDVLVTTGWSTFGYVAQGLAGLKSWILYVPSINDPSSFRQCRRAMSMDPCFHYPHYYDKVAGRMQDVGPLAPYLRHCEDAGWGLKLVDDKRGN